MAYDPNKPPALLANGIGGATGLRHYAYRSTTDSVAQVLASGYITNAKKIGLRAGDAVRFIDPFNNSHHLQVESVSGSGTGTLSFPDVAIEAIDLQEYPDVPGTYLVGYQDGRQARFDAEDVANEFINTKFIIPDAYGSVHGTDDSLALLLARDAAIAGGYTLLLPRGIYRTSETIDFVGDECHVVGMPGARIRATDTGFTGESVVRFGDISSGSFSQYCSLEGLIVDAANVVDIAVDWAYARFGRNDRVRTFGGALRGIRIGDPSAPAKSYEIDMQGVKTYYNDIANADGSVGIAWDYATDSYVSQGHSQGYRRGFLVGANSASVEMDKVHAWGRAANGLFDRPFDIQGSSVTLTQAYADTPFNVGQPGVTDLVAFNLHGFGTIMNLCRVFMTRSNTPDLATDGLISIVKMDRETFSSLGVIRVQGADASKRWREFWGGGFYSTSTLDAILDDGAATYLDSSTRFARGATSGAPKRQMTNILRDGPAGAARDYQVTTDGLIRWALRGDSTAEAGANAGTDFAIDAYNDAGSFLLRALSIVRATGAIAIGGLLSVTGFATFLGTLRKSGNAGTTRDIEFATGTSRRWGLRADSGAEAGANAGSDFALFSSSDTGTFIANVMTAKRSTGDIAMKAGTLEISLTWQKPLLGGSVGGGPAYIWINATSGKLYKKNTTAPTSDTDGTIVGTEA